MVLLKIKYIILLLFFSYVYSTRTKCQNAINQRMCNNIEIELNDFYCFKANFFFSKSIKCFPFPKEAKKQKLYLNLHNGLVKELYSFFGSYIKEIEKKAPEKLQEFGKSLYHTRKEFYKKDDIVVIEQGKFTKKDFDIISKDNTCTYHLYGKYKREKEIYYENIEDKNICFNADKFDDIKDIIDCGYATIRFSFGYDIHQIKTCYLIPNDNLPHNLTALFKSQIIGDIEENIGITHKLFNKIAKAHKVNNDEWDEEININKLNSLVYIIEVENKYGRKVKYSNDNKMEIISEGNKSNNKFEFTCTECSYTED